MTLDASDFNILPTVTGEDDCYVVISHRWSGKKWEWRGKESEWPKGRQEMLNRIAMELETKPQGETTAT